MSALGRHAQSLQKHPWAKGAELPSPPEESGWAGGHPTYLWFSASAGRSSMVVHKDMGEGHSSIPCCCQPLQSTYTFCQFFLLHLTTIRSTFIILSFLIALVSFWLQLLYSVFSFPSGAFSLNWNLPARKIASQIQMCHALHNLSCWFLLDSALPRAQVCRPMVFSRLIYFLKDHLAELNFKKY